MRVRADEMQIIDQIKAGDIGAILGCKNSRSGDTLLDELDNEIDICGLYEEVEELFGLRFLL